GTCVINSATLDVNAGTLTGSGTVTFGPATHVNWTSGTMSGSGVTNLLGSTTIGGVSLDARTVNNFGSVSNTANIAFLNGAVINNEAGATWNLQNGVVLSGSGTFNDFGTLTTTGSSTIANTTFTLPIGCILNGSGTVTFAATSNL